MELISMSFADGSDTFPARFNKSWSDLGYFFEKQGKEFGLLLPNPIVYRIFVNRIVR